VQSDIKKSSTKIQNQTERLNSKELKGKSSVKAQNENGSKTVKAKSSMKREA